MRARIRGWSWAHWLVAQIYLVALTLAAFLVTLQVGSLLGLNQPAPQPGQHVNTWRKATPDEERAWKIANENAVRWAELNSGVQSGDVR